MAIDLDNKQEIAETIAKGQVNSEKLLAAVEVLTRNLHEIVNVLVNLDPSLAKDIVTSLSSQITDEVIVTQEDDISVLTEEITELILNEEVELNLKDKDDKKQYIN